MDTNTQTVNSKVDTVDINLDEIFNAAPSGADVTLPEEKTNKNILSGLKNEADMSFADPDLDDADDLLAKVEDKAEEETSEEESTDDKKAQVEKEVSKEEIDNVLDTLDDVSEEEEKVEKEVERRYKVYQMYLQNLLMMIR